jgi:tyrosyl-tRNA synthetase
VLQKKLSEEVTRLVHGESGLQEAMDTTAKLFANQSAPAESLSVDDLEGMDGVVRYSLEAGKLSAGLDVVSFLSDLTIFPSKGEARKMVQGGGVSINRKKVGGVDMTIDPSLLLHDKYLLVQKGKKNYYLVVVE